MIPMTLQNIYGANTDDTPIRYTTFEGSPYGEYLCISPAPVGSNFVSIPIDEIGSYVAEKAIMTKMVTIA